MGDKYTKSKKPEMRGGCGTEPIFSQLLYLTENCQSSFTCSILFNFTEDSTHIKSYWY